MKVEFSLSKEARARALRQGLELAAIQTREVSRDQVEPDVWEYLCGMATQGSDGSTRVRLFEWPVPKLHATKTCELDFVPAGTDAGDHVNGAVAAHRQAWEDLQAQVRQAEGRLAEALTGDPLQWPELLMREQNQYDLPDAVTEDRLVSVLLLQSGTYRRLQQEWQSAIDRQLAEWIGRQDNPAAAWIDQRNELPNTLRIMLEKRLKAEIDAERNRRHDEAKAEQQAAKEAEARKMLAWIEEHGSTRLKRMAAEDISCRAVYLDERLALERPDWRWYQEVRGDYDDPRNPPEEAFTMLDQARRSEPDASLVYWSMPHDCDDDCEYSSDCPKYDWTGYAAVAEPEWCPEREIVFGLPAEVTASDE